MEYLNSQFTDFYDIRYMSILLRKSAQQIQVSLQSDMNNEYFTQTPIYIYDQNSLSSSENKKCFKQTL